MQPFTSSDTRKCREGSRDFCNFCVLPHAGKEFFNDARIKYDLKSELSPYKMHFISWRLRNLCMFQVKGSVMGSL